MTKKLCEGMEISFKDLPPNAEFSVRLEQMGCHFKRCLLKIDPKTGDGHNAISATVPDPGKQPGEKLKIPDDTFVVIERLP